jgi:very-short-patch-repair endonuclease
MRNHTLSSLRRARDLRRKMTLPEVLLWQRLRKKSLGVKFRKQHPMGDFVVDFYCDQAKTVIEVDGIVHDMGDQPDFDERRDEELRRAGYRIVRIPAAEVLHDPTAMAEAIVVMCQAIPPPSALRAATSPGGGGSKRSSA